MKRVFLITGFFVFLFQSIVSSADLKIAVVDLQLIFNNYNLRAKLINELKIEKEKMNKNMSDLNNQLQKIQSDLDTINPTSDTYRETQMKLIEIETKLKIMGRQYQQSFELKQLKMKSQLLKDIFKEIKKYSIENDIDLVLSKFTPGKTPDVEPVFITIYSKEKFDITSIIIKRLNSTGKK